jgi:hypothetical protein
MTAILFGVSRALLLLLIVAACGGDPTTQAPQRCTTCTTPDGGVLSLCELCTADSDCESGVCRMYGDGHRKCSTSCTAGESAPQCTSPAYGSCNLMGYCACPQYQPPSDAGTDPRDAPMAIDASMSIVTPSF